MTIHACHSYTTGAQSERTTAKYASTGLGKRFDPLRKNYLEPETPDPQISDERSFLFPTILINDHSTMFHVLIPLDGIDMRDVFVFATPNSIMLELRSKRILQHAGPISSEIQVQRITRELRCRDGIAKGSTTMNLVGGKLEITSIKAHTTGDEAWSEFIHMNTRCSLGMCGRP